MQNNVKYEINLNTAIEKLDVREIRRSLNSKLQKDMMIMFYKFLSLPCDLHGGELTITC